MKIKSIQLKNFKQFENYSVSCRDVNILTGPNNAGKSSILDALRICKDVVRFASRKNPEMVSQPTMGVCATYSLDDSIIGINTENIVHNYGDDDAEITVKIDNGNILVVKIHPERRTTAYIRVTGHIPRTSTQFKAAFPLNIIVVPTLSPFEVKEKWVSEDTARSNEGTRLSSRSFRNIWLRKSLEDLNNFNVLIQKGWPNISIQFPFVSGQDRIVEMFFTEERKDREIYWAGFGFQVWLQMMTHIMRGEPGAVLVLDEPDIYLHPDLQRRLTRVVQEKFSQIFLATHSTEIINEVNSGDVLSIESRTRNARRITSEEGYRHIFNYFGSSENAEFSRMARARRIVFFEGDDKRLLRRFAAKVSRSQILDDPDSVYLKTGGFGQWRRVNEVGWTLENVFGMRIKIAALFDSDYKCPEEIEEFKKEVTAPDIICHVLKRKEIENYALHEPAIIRAMIKRAEAADETLSAASCRLLIDTVFETLHEDVRSNRIGNFIRFYKKKEARLNETTLVSRAMKAFEPTWDDRDRRYELVGGKDFLSALSNQLHQEIGRSLTLAQIVQEMQSSEIPEDLIEIISSIENFFK